MQDEVSMKKFLTIFSICIILLSVTISLTSCLGKNPIPEGRYFYGHEENVPIDSLYGTIYDIKDGLFLKVKDEKNDPGQINYTVYEVYEYALNEDKTEITLTFTGYDYTGADDALRVIRGYETLKQYMIEQGEDTSFLFPEKGVSKTYSFELGEECFVLDGKTYKEID